MKIPIARDGYRFILPAMAVTLLMAWLYWPVAVVTGVLTAFFTYFFRDPERTTPNIEGAVFSSGDGLVDDIEEVDDPDFPGGRALKVGVFLSIFNCHITRSAVAGRVARIKYEAGAFGNAMNRQSSIDNENNRILLETAEGTIAVRQIAGAVARRIVCSARIGQNVAAGERVGLIRMGSRVEVYMPLGSDLRVKKGARVTAGTSVLAILSAHD